ncbi:Protein NipSnap-like protein 3B [Armadillidium nasatum]|uniref:Protein NipSnap-like protein 3B n=1 Tax=Armadillidium nasatum TaxID=96803 RepID=A0A5N5SKU1_9CRUS|nr:Protein NipSnap-like protein 3B [Armadillidium nasatum]
MMGITTRSLSTSSSEIYELRTYNIHPNKLKDYVSLTVNDFGPRIEKSKPLGFWLVELGGLNQALHIWPYDSVAHRSSVRSELAQSQEWNSRYLSKAGSFFQHMENSLLLSAGKQSPQERILKDCPLYEIHSHHMIKNNWSDSLEDFLNADFSNQQNGVSTLVGAFQTVCGQLDTVTLLWQHKNHDGVASLRRTLDDLHEYKTLRDYSDRINTKVLSPFITSHWK